MSGLLTLSQHTSHPAIPTTGNEHLYFYSDGKLYRMEEDGVPVEVGPAAAGGGPTTVYKTADESVTSSTTLQDDNDLFFAIGASEVWAFEFVLFVSGSTTGDMSVTLTVPTGFTRLIWSALGDDNGGFDSSSHVSASGTTAVLAGFGTGKVAVLKGSISNGATPGNVLLRWAQNVSDVTAITIKAGSYLVAHNIT